MGADRRKCKRQHRAEKYDDRSYSSHGIEIEHRGRRGGRVVFRFCAQILQVRMLQLCDLQR